MTRVMLLVGCLAAVWAHGAAPLEAPEASHEPEHQAEHEEAEPVLEYTVDFAVGLVELETVSGTTGEGAELTPTFEPSRIWTTTLLLGAEHPTPHATFGIRLPIVLGGITALETEKSSRVVGPLLGNIELEMLHATTLTEDLRFELAFELSLPTAFGEEPPLPGEGLEAPLNDVAVARGSVLRAAEFSRGSLDSALFEPGRVGFIPKLSLDFRAGAFHLRPTVKFELLMDTRGRAKEHLIGELVAGVRASYEIAHFVEPSLHAWTNITLTEHAERNVDVVLLEPAVRFRVGQLRPGLGVVVPLFGRLVDDHALAVRLSVTGEL